MAFQVSAYLNEWSNHLLGTKAYLSTALVVALPIIWMCSGRPFRALRNGVGRWWLGFLVLLILVLPFSAWRRDSLIQLTNDIPRSFLFFFYLGSFVVTLNSCRKIFYLNILTTVLLLLNCARFGAAAGSRFIVADDFFYQNSNELALSLLMGTTSFLYLFFLKGLGKKIFAGLGILGCLYYMLATGSRGSVLAAAACVLVVLFVVRNRIQVAVVAVSVAAIPLVLAPGTALHRIGLIFSSSEHPRNTDDASAIESQMERTMLLKKSIQITLEHPLTGIGIGQFPEYVAGQAEKQGKWSPWLGTHNSYTQVSSECGIPSLICYLMVIIGSFRLSYQIYKRTRDTGRKEIAGMGLCYLCAITIYAVATFFFHMAYTGGLAYLAGQVLALYLALSPVIENQHVRRSRTLAA